METSLGVGTAENCAEFVVGIPFACQCNFHIGKKRVARFNCYFTAGTNSG